jgi:hypothetical protein
MQEYMEKKKKPPVAPEPEEDVPFGGPEPSNEPPEKVAKALINKLQKKYADQSQEYKEAIDKALKALAKGDEEPMSHLLDADLTPKGQEQVWDQISTAAKLMKAKKITPLAAKNIVAAAIGNPGNPALVKLGEIWKANPPDTSPKKAANPIDELKAIHSAHGEDFKKKYKAFMNKHKLEPTQMMALTEAIEVGGIPEKDILESLAKYKAENKAAAKPKAVAKAEKEKGPSLSDQLKEIDKAKGIEHTKKYQEFKDKHKLEGLQVQVLKHQANQGATEEQLQKILNDYKAENEATAKYVQQGAGWPPDFKMAKGTQKTFTDSSDADASDFAEKSNAACAKLPKAQKDAIFRYSKGSTHMRDWLVYGKTDPFYKDSYYTAGMTGEAIQKACDKVSAGLKKLKHPPLLIDRKCSLMDWATADNPGGVTFKDLQKMAESGEVFENKAFLSSSVMDGGTYGDDQVVRHMYVPKKAPGGYIKSISNYGHEREFLLDKKTKTRIMKVTKDKSGQIHVYEEVVVDD